MRTSRRGDELHALLDAAVDGIVLIDHRGLIQSFNRAAERLFGYKAKELLGRSVNTLMTEEDRAAHNAHLARFLATRVPHIIGKGREVTARRKNGSTFPAFLSVGVVPEVEPPRFVGFVQDMTARRRAEDEARRLQDRLWHVSRLATVGEMASGIAHELNQPLAAIANYAQACDRLLARGDADLEEVGNALKEITTQAVRAGDIIRRLRGLAHHPNGPREPTDVNELILELTDLVLFDARAHDVNYRVELSEGLPLIDLYRSQIQQVILSLIRNAIESLAETDGTPREVVTRTARAHEGDIVVTVCDTGPGVSSAALPRLFDPFFSSKPAGTGLGLATSRTIVGRHRGSLHYRPNDPAGACFVLRLPFNSAEEDK